MNQTKVGSITTLIWTLTPYLTEDSVLLHVSLCEIDSKYSLMLNSSTTEVQTHRIVAVAN